jgi:hypothetical protein
MDFNFSRSNVVLSLIVNTGSCVMLYVMLVFFVSGKNIRDKEFLICNPSEKSKILSSTTRISIRCCCFATPSSAATRSETSAGSMTSQQEGYYWSLRFVRANAYIELQNNCQRWCPCERYP